MRVLLVEPAYRRMTAETKLRRTEVKDSPPSDDTLWYPPLGLMKLSRFHRARGDEVAFAYGCDESVVGDVSLFSLDQLWDRVYITTLFTYQWAETIRTIQFYRDAVGGTASKIHVGGVMASLMPQDLYEATGIHPFTGVLHSPSDIGLEGDVDIDLLPPDYSLVDGRLYAVNQTYYAYATRGCVNNCPWCGVPRVEPSYVPYIDIKPALRALREEHGDKPLLKMMDNNVLASPRLEQIVDDLLELGYGRGQTTASEAPKARVVDFNQGLDASLLTKDRMELLSALNVSPMRIAFDRWEEREEYLQAVRVARQFGVQMISNYLLYNWQDSPQDLYQRLVLNIELNEEWQENGRGAEGGAIYSYPMRYAPIGEREGKHANRSRNRVPPEPDTSASFLEHPVWNARFIRNVEVMKGAAHGAVSPTPSLARRTIGETYEEFLANLFMPEVMLRSRNEYERRVYEHEPKRDPGTGDVERFRRFILKLLHDQDERFWQFYHAVARNRAEDVRRALDGCKDGEMRKWLEHHLQR